MLVSAASDGSRRTDTQRGLCQRGFVILASMLVSSFQGMGEVTMGKVPWGSMLGSMLASVGVHVGFRVGLQV